MTDHDTRPVLLAVREDRYFEAALHFAAREATTRGCQLCLMHAYHVLPTGPDNVLLAFTAAENVASETLRSALEHASSILGGQVELTSTLVRGPIVQSIVDASAGCRLVVLQRRDLSPLSRVVTRSTSSAVAAHAHTPVAVVPEGWARTESAEAVVTVGVDVPGRSHAILRQALIEARARRASLRVLHTWWSPGYFDDIDMDRFGSSTWAVEVAEEIRAIVDETRVGFDDVEVAVETHHGRPVDTLVAASRSSELLVVGRHDPRVPMGSHLGPVARAVLRTAECPVLLVAPSEAHHGWRGRPRQRAAQDVGPVA
jgi:nucleotide-binding universal stress UspA family protein